MHLDPLTLMLPGAFATTLAGLFLLGAHLHFKTAPALVWWAAAKIVNGVGLAFLTFGLGTHTQLSVVAGVGLMTLAPSLIWGGFRRFANQPASPVLLLAGIAIWLTIVFLPFDIDHQKWSTLANFVIWCVYLLVTVELLWRSLEEKFNARVPLIGLLAIHAAMYFGAAYELLIGAFPLDGPPRLDTFFGAIHFETILYAMGTSIFMVLLCRERIELGYIKAARTDALTGVANRAALFETADRLFKRCQQQSSPFSLIMLDLDHFKAINDTYGHQSGDRVLRSFVDVVAGILRPNDFCGRYGGEEFVVILPGATIETAHAIAERVCRAFADSHRFLDGQVLNATVSAGVAQSSPSATLDTMMQAADKALYVAKGKGRNRVERAGCHSPAVGGKVIRIA